MKKSALTSAFLLAVFAVVPLSSKENRASEYNLKHGTHAAVGKSKTEYKVYKARDGSRVVIANKSKEEATPESVVAFYSPENQKMCSVNFSSEDREHGYGVVKAAWTPDQEYFVFSMTSSGGHQAWHSPTVFFSLRDAMIRSLDSYTKRPISTGGFILKSSNTVLTEVWHAEGQESVRAEFRLGSLIEGKHRSHHALQCADGRAFRVDPYDLRNHD